MNNSAVNDTAGEPIARLSLSIPDLRSPCAGKESVEQVVTLYPGQKVRIGRAIENDIVLEDPLVSREHVLIEWNGNGFFINDLSSVNGTFVNNMRLASSPRQLRDGDEISLSRHVLVFELLRNNLQEVILPVNEAGALAAEFQNPRLVVCAGPDMGQEFPLWGEVITIGRACRDATWEIRLTDRSVSRPHARLERSKNGCILLDLQSANGTLVNNNPVQSPVAIESGDLITIGETSLVYCP